MLAVFQANVEPFMKNGRLSPNDPNFIYESNVLDFVSNGSGSCFPQIHLIDTIEFKRPVEYQRHSELRKRVNKVNEGCLFLYYISKTTTEPCVMLPQDLLDTLNDIRSYPI